MRWWWCRGERGGGGRATSVESRAASPPASWCRSPGALLPKVAMARKLEGPPSNRKPEGLPRRPADPAEALRQENVGLRERDVPVVEKRGCGAASRPRPHLRLHIPPRKFPCSSRAASVEGWEGGRGGGRELPPGAHRQELVLGWEGGRAEFHAGRSQPAETLE